MRDEAVITGVGVLAANGMGKEAFWRSLLAGESGIGPITRFDSSKWPSRIAGEIKGFRPEEYIDKGLKPRRECRNAQFAGAAARMALNDAGLTADDLRRTAPIAIRVGVGLGGFDHLERQMRRIIRQGPDRVAPSAVEGSVHLAAASLISRMLGVRARIGTVSNSCASGLDAIAEAAGLVSSGLVDVALAGGTDAVIGALAMSGVCAVGMVSTHNDEPGKASRPFDRLRDGGVMAEGCGLVVLESARHARVRGAKPYAVIRGHGTAGDTNGDPRLSGLFYAMEEALGHAGCRPEHIDFISAHAPSDPRFDRMETDLIKRFMGDRAYQIPVTSIKGATGNAVSASGAHQVVACALSFREGLVPPTANYEHPDPACDLDVVNGAPRRADLRVALLHSHGSGGANSALVLGRPEPS